MSTQRGNAKKKGPPKYQNKSGFKNVYHDTSKQTKTIVSTEVSGVCRRCKEAIDWKIKYKKYKPLTQPKTCVMCKQKRIKQAYHTYCIPCSTEADKCAKCGEKNEIIMEPKMSEADQAREDRQLQFELEMLPERKRRTFLRLQEKGLLPTNKKGVQFDDVEDASDNESDVDSDVDSDSETNAEGTGNGPNELEMTTDVCRPTNKLMVEEQESTVCEK